MTISVDYQRLCTGSVWRGQQGTVSAAHSPHRRRQDWDLQAIRAVKVGAGRVRVVGLRRQCK